MRVNRPQGYQPIFKGKKPKQAKEVISTNPIKTLDYLTLKYKG